MKIKNMQSPKSHQKNNHNDLITQRFKKKSTMIVGKKIRIKAPRKMTWVQDGQSPQQFFSATWPEVSASVLLILKDLSSTSLLSYQENYSKVYQICISQMSKVLYQSLGDVVARYLDTADENCTYSQLQSFYLFWSDFVEKSKVLSSFFLYLDRVYSTGIAIPHCYDMCLLKFRDSVVLKHIESLKKDIVQCLKQVRDSKYNSGNHIGDGIDCHSSEVLLSNVFKMLQLLDLFGNTTVFNFHLEPCLLEDYGIYYGQLADENIAKLNPSQYVDLIYHVLETEKSIISSITTDVDFQIKIQKIIEKKFITEKRERLVADSFKMFIESKQYGDIGKIMDLFDRDSQNMEYLWEVFAQECYNSFSSITENKTLPRKKQQANWIQSYLDMSKDFTVLVEHVFIMKTQMLAHINDGISKAINKDSAKAADYLSQFLDLYLRGETEWSKPMSKVNAIEKTIVKCVRLLQLIKDQDTFELSYKQQLSKRLLQKRSNLEAEKLVLIKMKESLGSNFTAKLEGMVHDVVVSLNHNKKFNSTESYDHPFELEASILTNTCWPFQSLQPVGTADETSLVLPPSLKRYGLDFENCYIKSFEGRKITWAHPYGFLDVGYQFNKTYHTISMPFYAGLIFLLFENYSQLTTRQIKEYTQIPSNEIIRNLASMALAPKTKVLTKYPMTKSIKDSDVFSINEDFTSPMENVKLVLAIISKGSSKEGGSAVKNSNSETNITSVGDTAMQSSPDTQPVIDAGQLKETRKWKGIAAVMRVMKKHRSMEMSKLHEMVSEEPEVNFVLESDLFQDILDYAVEKEYLSIDEKKEVTYNP